MAEPNATLEASVDLVAYAVGNYAGMLVVRGRRGEVRPKLSASPKHGGVPWTVHVRRRQAEHGEAVSVAVEVPWRLSSQSLTQEEAARILDLVREKAGDFVVID